MSTLSTSVSTTSSNATMSTGDWYCTTHGYANCGCNSLVGGTYGGSITGGNMWGICQTYCGNCHVYYNSQYAHSCTASFPVQIKCTMCGAVYACGTMHLCTGTTTTSTPFILNLEPVLKDLKEITTEVELIYKWSGLVGYDLYLPQKFSDCFLKVGNKYSPLYPLVFSTYAGDDKTISFRIVVSIADKVFEGDQVVLKSISTEKVDNLSLAQFVSQVREYFK